MIRPSSALSYCQMCAFCSLQHTMLNPLWMQLSVSSVMVVKFPVSVWPEQMFQASLIL